MELAHLYPLIVPSSYVRGTAWDLPHYPLPNKNFIVTWVSFDAGEAMTYLTRAEYETLEATQPGWQRVALDNLRHSLTEEENLFTHAKVSADASRVVFFACMHQDGIGSSRLLLASDWSQAFPQGYYLALPDRSCGLLVPHRVTAAELADVQRLVKSMYHGATTPMSDQLFVSADFTLPAAWTAPLDAQVDQALLAAIAHLTTPTSPQFPLPASASNLSDYQATASKPWWRFW